MGQALKKPPSTESQRTIEQEINRLLHSYSYLLKGVSEKRKVSGIDTMKQNMIHQQWRIVFPLLHPSDQKDNYKRKFDEYVANFHMWKFTGLENVLEESLLRDT